MKIKIILILTFLYTFLSCKDDDCYIPSEDIIFEFVNDKNENLIENGEIDSSKIAINKIINNDTQIGITNNKIVNNRVVLNPKISRSDGIQSFIFITNLKVFSFKIISSKRQDCNAYNIIGLDFDSLNVNQSNNIYKILIK